MSCNLTAIPAAIRIVREEGIDVVVTTSPPPSVHLIGAAVKRATGVRWVADLRDSLVAHPHRDAESWSCARRSRGEHAVAALVARQADAIVAVSEAIAAEMRERDPARAGRDDRERLRLRRLRRARVPAAAERFRITHAGSFFGKRDPRPFLTALARVDGVVARFVGDFRSADREWASRDSCDRIELDPLRAAPPRRSSCSATRRRCCS